MRFSAGNNIPLNLARKTQSNAFQIIENDGLPNQVCLQCVDSITKSFLFKQRCEESETRLRDCFNKPFLPTKFLELKTIQNSDNVDLTTHETVSELGVSNSLHSVAQVIDSVVNSCVSANQTVADQNETTSLLISIINPNMKLECAEEDYILGTRTIPPLNRILI